MVKYIVVYYAGLNKVQLSNASVKQYVILCIRLLLHKNFIYTILSSQNSFLPLPSLPALSQLYVGNKVLKLQFYEIEIRIFDLMKIYLLCILFLQYIVLYAIIS